MKGLAADLKAAIASLAAKEKPAEKKPAEKKAPPQRPEEK